MPAAKTKTDLLRVTEKEIPSATPCPTACPDTLRLWPDPDAQGTTPKDIVGHRANWITLFLDWYAKGQAGKPVQTPAEGYKWTDLKRLNADLRAAQSDLSWDAACALLRENHARLLGFPACWV